MANKLMKRCSEITRHLRNATQSHMKYQFTLTTGKGSIPTTYIPCVAIKSIDEGMEKLEINAASMENKLSVPQKFKHSP